MSPEGIYVYTIRVTCSTCGKVSIFTQQIKCDQYSNPEEKIRNYCIKLSEIKYLLK